MTIMATSEQPPIVYLDRSGWATEHGTKWLTGKPEAVFWSSSDLLTVWE